MAPCAWTATHGSTLGYEPNGYGQWQEQPDFREPPLKINGAADRRDYRQDDADYFSQPRALFRLMTPAQQQVLFDNTARAMGDAPDEIKRRHIANCTQCDPAYGAGVAKALGLSVPKYAQMHPSPGYPPVKDFFAATSPCWPIPWDGIA